jgi:amino acid adenylation domain-containing protein
MLSDAQRKALTGRLRQVQGEIPGGIAPRPAGTTNLPLSSGQEQLWFLDRFAPGLATYNIPIAVRLTGPLDAAALERALDALVARHEALRTRLVADASGQPVQVVDEPAGAGLTVFELADETRLTEFADEEAMRPFVLATGPLFRFRLVRLSGTEHVLVVVVHHAVFDGWSIRVMMTDVAELYRAEVTGGPAELPELAVQFADYALWERDRLQGEALAEQIAYWRTTLDGLPTLQLPADRPRPAVVSHEGALEQVNLGGEVLAGLTELARRQGTTLFVTLLAALQALLQRYTGQDDVVVGTVSANRGRSKLAPMIGFLVNTLAIRTDLSGDPAFTELLGRVREVTVGAYGHQDLPFARLVDELRVERDPGRTPVFGVCMSLAEAPGDLEAAGLTMRLELVDLPVAKFDLNLFAEVRDGELTVEAAYATALFDPPTIRRFLGHLNVLLAAVVKDPGRRLSELPILTDAELHRELVEWNDTAIDLPVVTIHEGFERQVARTPDGIAAEMDGETVTYAELNAEANQVARRLRALGVETETLVGVCMFPSPRRLAVLLGIMKAGGGYVPLDPALPAERLSYMIGDAAMPLVVADAGGAAVLPDTAARTVRLDREWPEISVLDPGNPGFEVRTSNVAYVIYTSGSTGRPKGVVVEHRNVSNFLTGMIDEWKIGPEDRVLQFASFSFDASVMDMFMTLLAGARVVLAQRGTLLSPARLADLMRRRQVTFACLTPSVMGLLAQSGPFPDLRLFLAGGEQFPAELVTAFARPGMRLINEYGPTETAVATVSADLDGPEVVPPIGRPKPNCRAYVLDAKLNPVPVGVVGELHLGGVQVARGYLNAPELTAKRFIGDPFDDRPGARLYKTGDLVRRLPDGTLVFVGRLDGQVKIRGLRVELGEIEAALLAHPAVAQAVAVVATDRTGERQLAGYYRLDPDTPGATTAELRQHLTLRLPVYMVPGHLMAVQDFALNGSRKIDKSALPPIDEAVRTAGYEAPHTLIETVLADMYAGLLGREQIGAEDGFFELGGNSLQAIRLITQIADELDPEPDIDVAAIFLAPTPRQLAVLLCDKHGLEDVDLSEEDTASLMAPSE